MIRTLILILSFSCFLASCSKSDDPGTCTYKESGTVAPTSEIDSLQRWVTANRPAAIKHSSGFFYEIISSGTGTVAPTVCNNVAVRYYGWLFDLTKFDENLSGLTFSLGNLITGWQKGIPLIRTGGTIYLYLPPSLGYGSTATGAIPANSYLIFSVQLLRVE